MSFLYYLNPLNHVLSPVRSLVTQTCGWLYGGNKTTSQKVYSGAVIAKDSVIIGYSALAIVQPTMAALIFSHISSVITISGWGLLKLIIAIFII